MTWNNLTRVLDQLAVQLLGSQLTETSRRGLMPTVRQISKDRVLFPLRLLHTPVYLRVNHILGDNITSHGRADEDWGARDTDCRKLYLKDSVADSRGCHSVLIWGLPGTASPPLLQPLCTSACVAAQWLRDTAISSSHTPFCSAVCVLLSSEHKLGQSLWR